MDSSILRGTGGPRSPQKFSWPLTFPGSHKILNFEHHKSAIKPWGLTYFFAVLEGGLIERDLFLTKDKDFIKMVFCIPSVLFPLKIQCHQRRKFIYTSQLNVFL